MITAAVWPTLDYSRVPYRLYHDTEIYACEQERIFHGPVWSFLGLDDEIPQPGDFRATWVGETPVIFNRDRSGAVRAFVNRCAHRGALVRRELAGNAEQHVCIYHQWCYGLDGGLMAIPFRRGIRGKGGLDASFEMSRHGLRPLRVGSINGALFGTLAENAEPLEDYLGAPILAQLRRLFDRPVRVLGYNRQRIRGNWKLYAENTRDNYHASLLHEFLVTFGLDRSTQVGGVKMDARHRHNITWAEADSDTDEFARQTYSTVRVRNDFLSLKQPALVAFHPERDDKLNLVVTSVFPAAVFVQISNSLAVRQIRPRGVDEVEIFQTMLGYRDDPPEMTLHRLRQANLVGPAGLVSMEDGEAIEIAHRASRPAVDSTTVIELGGAGAISDRDYRVTDVAVAWILVLLCRAVGYRARRRGAMNWDTAAVCALLAEYGALIDGAKFDEWLCLFAEECRYQIVPRENFDRGLPAALVFCDSRAMLEDRIRALREANKYNIHTDRHVIGLPRIFPGRLAVEAPFAVYQTDQEGETRLFATGVYHDRFEPAGEHLKIRDKLILLDTFAVPSLLATPL